MIINKEIEKLFKIVRTKLGGGVRVTELTDDTLCDLLEKAIGDYTEMVHNFIIESNWANMYGKNLNSIDWSYVLSVRGLDLSKDYALYFSKEVGLQQRGTKWELKKDFIKIEEGKQCYIVPAGREICKVMWYTPSAIDQAKWAGYGGYGVYVGGGVYGQMGGAGYAFGGFGSGVNGSYGLWALPAYDVALMTMDLNTKNSIFRSDLTYKVTAGPDGTHIIHLFSTPGCKATFSQGGPGQYNLGGGELWYTYYDTDGDADECRLANPDILLSPDQVPLAELHYTTLNVATQNLVRNLLIAEAAETLAFIRGKFSGNINFLGSPLSMDYNQLMTYGNNERKRVMDELTDRLKRLSPFEMMKQNAELTDSLKKIRSGVPLPIIVR